MEVLMRRVALLTAIGYVATGCGSATAPSPAVVGQSTSSPSVASAARTSAPSTIPTPSAVALPSGRIAFTLDVGDEGSEVYLANTDGSRRTQLTAEGGGVDNLVWAPDGSRLYLTVTHQKVCGVTYCYPMHVVSIRPDGTDRVDLGQIGAWGVGSVSPDRRFVAYPGGEGYPEDNGQSFLIPTQVLDLMAGEMSHLGAAGTAWSPENNRLLGAASDHIAVVDARSGETLVRIDDPWAVPDADVGWSPDGGSIFYHRCAPDLNKIEAMTCMAGPSWIVNLADPNFNPEPNLGREPPKGMLSPDGQWLASFIVAGEVPDGLYILPATGGEPRLVARLELDDGALEHPPSWSPGGQWLAVGLPGGIHLVAAGGGEPIAVTLGGGPAWQPVPPDA
jgi:dipeptidyl aminopeptidase/acylaminoacyl peptidase